MSDFITQRLKRAGGLLFFLGGKMKDYSKEIEELRNTSDNWEGYGAPAPTAEALMLAEAVVCTLDQYGFDIEDIGPDAMGGVDIYVPLKNKDAWIMIKNDNNAIFLTTHSKASYRDDRDSIIVSDLNQMICDLTGLNKDI